MLRRDLSNNYTWPDWVPDEVFASILNLETDLGITVGFGHAPHVGVPESSVFVPVNYNAFDTAQRDAMQDVIGYRAIFDPTIELGSSVYFCHHHPQAAQIHRVTLPNGDPFAVAERTGRHVAILWNFFETGNAIDHICKRYSAQPFLGLLKEKYCALLTETLTFVAAQIRDIRQGPPVDILAGDYADAVIRVAARQFEARNGAFAQIQQQIADVERSLLNLYAQAEQHKQTIANVAKLRERVSADLQLQMRNIVAHPYTELVCIVGEELRLYTREIAAYIAEMRQFKLLGRYYVRFGLNMQQATVTVENLDRVLNGRPHPHMNGGTVCMGSAKPLILSGLASGEFDAAVMGLYQWFTGIDPGDAWGASVKNFPTIDKDHPAAQLYITLTGWRDPSEDAPPPPAPTEAPAPVPVGDVPPPTVIRFDE